MTTSTLTKTLCALALAVASAAHAAPTYKGSGTFATRVHFKNAKLAAKADMARTGEANLSFAVDQGVLQIKMDRPDGEKWAQGFVVKSDMTDGAGVRTIDFDRPALGSALARDNKRVLNDPGTSKLGRRILARLLGGYKALVGGGQLKIDGDKLTLTNSGSAITRVLFVNRLATWNESFAGQASE
jgi:hypothetical protein